MTNDELIEIVARHVVTKISDLGIDYWSAGVVENERYGDDQQTTDAFRFIASLAIAALRAAGAIPAEGTVTIDAARWERVLALAQAAVRLDGATAMKVVEIEDQYVLYGMARNSEECRIALWSAMIGMGGIRDDDLDAVSVSSEPPQAPAQTP